MSKYGKTIEIMKAARAAIIRQLKGEQKKDNEARSRAEVAADEAHDDLILQGFKKPTVEDIAKVLIWHEARQPEQAHESSLAPLERGVQRIEKNEFANPYEAEYDDTY
jgi:hypothetical protein